MIMQKLLILIPPRRRQLRQQAQRWLGGGSAARPRPPNGPCRQQKIAPQRNKERELHGSQGKSLAQIVEQNGMQPESNYGDRESPVDLG